MFSLNPLKTHSLRYLTELPSAIPPHSHRPPRGTTRPGEARWCPQTLADVPDTRTPSRAHTHQTHPWWARNLWRIYSNDGTRHPAHVLWRRHAPCRRSRWRCCVLEYIYCCGSCWSLCPPTRAENKLDALSRATSPSRRHTRPIRDIRADTHASLSDSHLSPEDASRCQHTASDGSRAPPPDTLYGVEMRSQQSARARLRSLLFLMRRVACLQ